MWKRSLAAISLTLASCASLGEFDRALGQAIPMHPVTGVPVANVISDADEARSSAESHARIEAAVRQEGYALDPPGPHLDQMIRVIERLAPVATTHRPTLPWQYWLIPDRTVHAFTTGGGYVYVHDGLWGPRGLIREGDDDELAFVLAHEMAHVNLLHVPLRRTQAIFNDRMREDPFFSASYTTEQEAEADRLAVLYASLAGYDPEAGARIWDRTGDTEATHGYRNSHPVGADRAARIRAAHREVRHYRVAGQVNPSWAQLLADNPLFRRRSVSSAPPAPGAGLAKAIALGVETKLAHEAAKAEAERREQAFQQSPAAQQQLVQVVALQVTEPVWGRVQLSIRLRNGAQYPIAGIRFAASYLQGSSVVYTDQSCGGPVSLAAGQTVDLTCAYAKVAGVDRYAASVAEVTFGR